MNKLQAQILQNLPKDNEIKGIVCVDNKGISYHCSGSFDPKSSAMLSQVYNLGSQLEPNNQPLAISIANANSKILIKKHDDFMVGIHKNSKN